MARYPGAAWRPWYPYQPERYIIATTVIVHTNAVNAEDPGRQGTLSWHFQVGQHGDIYQHRDTATRAAANAYANDFAISIETWDGGNPEGNPWNAAQIDSLIGLIGWCCNTHKIPRSAVTRWDGPGVGYHRQFNQWNQPYHSCPGNTRVNQFNTVILPGLVASPVTPPLWERFDMVPAQVRDADGRKWFFIVGDDLDCWASVNNGGFFPLVGRGLDGKPKTAFTSGLSAVLESTGQVVVVGRGADGRAYQIVFTPGDPAPAYVGVVDSHPHHIFPPA